MHSAPVGASRAHALSRDAALVCVAGAFRAAAVSTVGIIIALHLARSGLSASEIGLVISLGMAANAAATVLVGFHADRWGQRRSLIALGLLAGAGYVAIGIAGSLPVFLAVAVIALVNGMGRDRGPASAPRAGTAADDDDRRTPYVDDGLVQRRDRQRSRIGGARGCVADAIGWSGWAD